MGATPTHSPQTEMQLLAATVSKAPRRVQTRFGDRLVCDIVLPDGSETAIWGPVNYAPLEYLERGQAVTVSRDSKGKVSIVENHLTHPGMTAPAIPQQTQTNPAPAANAYSLDPDTKKAIAQYVTQQKDLLQFCWQQAETIEGPQTEDVVQKLAVTLYLSAQRKFSL